MSEQFQKARGTLFIDRPVKEKPQLSFLTNLFSGRNEAVDRDDLFGGSGKGSTQVATHIPGANDITAAVGCKYTFFASIFTSIFQQKMF